MKYLFVMTVLSLTLVACHSNPAKFSQAPDKIETTRTIDDSEKSNIMTHQTINFVGPDNLKIELKTTDNFETAEMTDNTNKIYHLSRAISGSGIRLANKDGVAIHFKTNSNNVTEGYVELVSGKFINIIESKTK